MGKVLGRVACKVTSKRLGIGSAERAWKDVKHIKSGQSSHMKANRIEKQSVIYTTACVEESRLKQKGRKMKPLIWGEDDEKMQLDLEKFGVDCVELSQPILPKRKFRCWLEEWEEPLLAKNDLIAMKKLLQKYKSMIFYDPDDQMTCTVSEDSLYFEKPGRKNGWAVLGIPENWDGVSEDEWQPFSIRSGIVFDMVKDTAQPQEAHITVVKEPSDEYDTDNDSDSSASSDTIDSASSNSNDSSEDESQDS